MLALYTLTIFTGAFLLQESRVPMPVTLGDARLSLTQVPDGAYDLIVLDAYSSDAIPVHLITREALRLYLHKLAPHGLLLLRISNQYLEPVVGALARDAGLVCRAQTDMNVTRSAAARGKTPSQWAVMARDTHDLGPLNADARWQPARLRQNVPVWTDDFSSILSVFRWH